MKKIISAFLLLILLSALFAADLTNVSAISASYNTPEVADDISDSAEKQMPKDNQKPSKPKPPVNGEKPFARELQTIEKAAARSAYLMDFASGTVMFAQNEREHFPIASMCKIMSLLLIFEKYDGGGFEECSEITISENASSMGGSQVFLEANGTYKICDLIKSIIVASANDATVAMAEFISGSEESFIAEMNEKAKELGMKDTVFVNCTGLPQPGQYSCAQDVAVMTRELLKHNIYYKYSRIWMDKITHSEGRVTEISNTNKLVRFFKGCDGGKTGYTSEAKHCVSATALRDNMRLISVIIGAEDSKTRFAEASRLLNYGFAAYTSKQIVAAGQPVGIKATVRGGKVKEIEILPEEGFSVLMGKFDKSKYSVDYNINDKISAPLKKGDRVGVLSVICDNKVVKEINLVSAQDVQKKTYGDSFGEIIENW